MAFDPAAGARLVEFVRTVNTACSNKLLAASGTISWNDVFHGTIAEGATCQIAEECQKSSKGMAACTQSSHSTGADSSGYPVIVYSRVCEYITSPTSPVYAEWGQPCSGSCTSQNGRCVSGPSSVKEASPCFATHGLYCQTGTCAAVAQIGQACSDGLFCESGGHCEAGVCVANTADGACSAEDQCLLSSYCDQDAKLCRPLKAADAECAHGFECEGGGCEQNLCNHWSVASASTCGGSALSGEVE